jgi:predicted deacylase
VPLREILRVQEPGRNKDGYHGETIDIAAVLREIQIAAQQLGWTAEVFHEAGGFKLFALHRKPLPTLNAQPSSRIYISTGIHGDEPAGPIAALRLLQENRWLENVEMFLLPCLNPSGFTLNRRENAGGRDLNRDYRNPKSAEVRAHIAWLERQPGFDLSLCLHEDWETQGFYVYELNPDNRPSLAETMIDRIGKVCPIDLSEMIEGRAARNGIIRPDIDPRTRPDWPEAFYLITCKTRLSCTLEAPSDFPLPVRVSALVTGVNAALDKFNHHG